MNASISPHRSADYVWNRIVEAARFRPFASVDLFSPGAQARWIWAFVCLGLAARAVRFLLCFPLWEDECFLAANYIGRGYGDLLNSPLNFHQVAPLGYLWMELGCVKLFGFSEWGLRVFPFACGVASLLLFRRLAVRLLEGSARTLAVAMFCASYSGIRYAAEAKPYGSDTFAALLLLTLCVEFWRRPDRDRWLWALAVLTPAALALSYPAVFVAGGVSLATGLALWTRAPAPSRRQAIAGWLAWIAYNAAMLTAFAWLLSLAARRQAAAELGFMQEFWQANLPVLASPWGFVKWLATTHTGALLSIPVGSERGGSTLTLLACLVGLGALVRARRAMLLLLCLAPAALNIVAALLGRYPYGGHVKFAQYLSPAICLLIGVGGAAILAWHERRTQRAGRALAIALAISSLVAWGTMARDFVYPYKSRTDLRYRDFARWFWFNMESAGEAVCLKTDLGEEFSPATYHELGWSAMYLCNQQIYSPRHARGGAPDLDRVSDDWPLRCVEFRAQVHPYDAAAHDAWLEKMRERYDLVSQDTYPFPCYDQRGRKLLCLDAIEVYKFVPRGSQARRAAKSKAR